MIRRARLTDVSCRGDRAAAIMGWNMIISSAPLNGNLVHKQYPAPSASSGSHRGSFRPVSLQLALAR